VSPTFHAAPRARREYRRLAREQQLAFDNARGMFVSALRNRPAHFPSALRVKGVQGHPGVFELSFGDAAGPRFSTATTYASARLT